MVEIEIKGRTPTAALLVALSVEAAFGYDLLLRGLNYIDSRFGLHSDLDNYRESLETFASTQEVTMQVLTNAAFYALPMAALSVAGVEHVCSRYERRLEDSTPMSEIHKEHKLRIKYCGEEYEKFKEHLDNLQIRIRDAIQPLNQSLYQVLEISSLLY